MKNELNQGISVLDLVLSNYSRRLTGAEISGIHELIDNYGEEEIQERIEGLLDLATLEKKSLNLLFGPLNPHKPFTVVDYLNREIEMDREEKRRLEEIKLQKEIEIQNESAFKAVIDINP